MLKHLLIVQKIKRTEKKYMDIIQQQGIWTYEHKKINTQINLMNLKITISLR